MNRAEGIMGRSFIQCSAFSASLRNRLLGLRAMAIVLLGYALSACMAPSHYQGIQIAGISATAPKCLFNKEASVCYQSVPLRSLARLAQVNDKHAQFELAERFASGCGLDRNLKVAENLFRLAASDIGGSAVAYLPSQVGGGRGRIIHEKTDVKVAGLLGARKRLANLRSADPYTRAIDDWQFGVCNSLPLKR